MYLLIRATGGIRLTASGPVLVQQPAAAGRVRSLAAARPRVWLNVSTNNTFLRLASSARSYNKLVLILTRHTLARAGLANRLLDSH